MLRLVGRRLRSILLVSLAIVYFGFLGMRLIETADTVAAGYQLGQDVALAGRDTLTFFAGLLSGRLEPVETVFGPRPVSDILWESYRNSMGLLLMALAGAVVVGLLVGSLAALTKRRQRQYSLLLLTLVGVSAPSFLIAVLLQQAGITYTVTFGRRLVSMGGYAWDFQHLAMPLLVLAARPIAYLTRSSFVTLGHIMNEDYMRTAFAKGLSLTRATLTHALPNLAVPILTAVGVSLRFSLSTLPLVEFIFAWPGMGLSILEAINDRVPLLVVSLALAIGLTIQLVNLLLELLYRLVDPRLRETL